MIHLAGISTKDESLLELQLYFVSRDDKGALDNKSRHGGYRDVHRAEFYFEDDRQYEHFEGLAIAQTLRALAQAGCSRKRRQQPSMDH